MRVISEVKAVKNSVFILQDDDSFSCVHYDTEIFKAVRNTFGYTVKVLNVPTVTSNKMARRCYEYVFNNKLDQREWKLLKEEMKL